MPTPSSSPTQGMRAAQLPELPPGPSLDSVRGPIEESVFSTGQIIAVTLIGIIVGSFLLWHVIAYIRYRNELKAALPPAKLATQQLEDAMGIEQDQEFASAHSDAFRNYLDAVLETDVRGKTTAELSRELTAGLPVNGHDVSQFLEGCDQVKFARARLSDDDRIQLSNTAAKLIDSVEASRIKAQSKEVAAK